jgi:hypothetical protein
MRPNSKSQRHNLRKKPKPSHESTEERFTARGDFCCRTNSQTRNTQGTKTKLVLRRTSPAHRKDRADSPPERARPEQILKLAVATTLPLHPPFSRLSSSRQTKQNRSTRRRRERTEAGAWTGENRNHRSDGKIKSLGRQLDQGRNLEAGLKISTQKISTAEPALGTESRRATRKTKSLRCVLSRNRCTRERSRNLGPQICSAARRKSETAGIDRRTDPVRDENQGEQGTRAEPTQKENPKLGPGKITTLTERTGSDLRT